VCRNVVPWTSSPDGGENSKDSLMLLRHSQRRDQREDADCGTGGADDENDVDGFSDHAPPFQFDRIVCRDSSSAALTVSQRAQATGSINSLIACSVHSRRSRGSIASISQQRVPYRSTNQE